ncbi:MAG: DUF1015 domain-containing protein [Rhodoplanes sp.]
MIRPFRAIRAARRHAADVAAPPYDVLSTDEAREQARGRPLSFLHVSRPEIDLPPGADPHAPEAYAKAAEAMQRMIEDGVLLRDSRPAYYVYRITAGGHRQSGIVAAASVAGYASGRIRRHELTRPEKEADRARQIEAVGAHTGPVFVLHRPSAEVASVVSASTDENPLADVTDAAGARHQIWRVDADDRVTALSAAFEAMDALYIADGHHRAAAAARVAKARRPAYGSPGEAAPRFLIVSFPSDEVRILDYNRLVRDLNGHTPETLLGQLARAFAVRPENAPVRPARPHEFGMVLGGHWYRLVLREAPSANAGPLERLDISLLSRHVLNPVLGIGDPRTDSRIDFVGGSRGLDELERRVGAGLWAVGFSLYPTALDDLMTVADAGEVMPPKSTWFEPKLADGLLSLPLDDGETGPSEHK